MIQPFNSGRRQFLKVGLLGSSILAAAGVAAINRDPELCVDCLWLRKGDKQMLQALVPVMLAGALPDGGEHRQRSIDEVVTGVDFTIAHFPPAVRDEIRQLLWLLESSFMRPLFTGIWSDWPSTSEAEIQKFLKRWKGSGLDLLRVGYTALHDLIVGAWYANSGSWQRIGYPGPPRLS